MAENTRSDSFKELIEKNELTPLESEVALCLWVLFKCIQEIKDPDKKDTAEGEFILLAKLLVP